MIYQLRILPLLVWLTLATSFPGAFSEASGGSSTTTATAPPVGASSSTGGTETESIPRSSHRVTDPTSISYPPWNPSPFLDDHGFLLKQYRRVPGEWEREFRLGTKKRNRKSNNGPFGGNLTPVTVRQVPGDGNCLFHSISTCYAQAINGTHLDLRNPTNLQWLYQTSAQLRAQAVDVLEQPRKLLFLQGHEYLKCQDLVQAAASQYGITGEEYCRLMRQDSYWGGGPEIVALCNVLQRPIHVYELANERHRFVLRRMACFGSPRFDRQEALHILSADSRFPDVIPGRQLPSGNHFLALFPSEADDGGDDDDEKDKKKKKRAKLRGGDLRETPGGWDKVMPPSSRLRRLWNRWSIL